MRGMALWPCSSPSKSLDVSAQLDDIIKRLAAGDTSTDLSFDSTVSGSSYADNNNETDPDKVKCPEKCDGLSENIVESRAENVCGVEEPERSSRSAPQLSQTINTDDVKSRDQPCLETACSAGSYSRRKHHKKHKDRHRNTPLHSPTPAEANPPEDTPDTKIKPVFVWVRQEDCRIVEVMCEDYDKRNRLRLAKTPLGWRAIPKTEVFAAAVIPKVSKEPKIERRKKHKKSRKKHKKCRPSSPPVQQSGQVVLQKCSVSLTRTDIYEFTEEHDNNLEDINERIKKEVTEEMSEYSETPPSKMTKSSSCDFKEIKDKPPLVRSSSLNFSIAQVPQVQTIPEPADLGIKIEEDAVDKVLDISKDGELNDNDCDELGMLLKEIPDLEFVEEEDVNAGDDFEELGLPKDLTLPKTKEPHKLPQLPPNISSLVTVTSSARPPQPLTAPLPEVTITPIPNPKPAHQQKPQNKYLESLLSASRTPKPENEVLATKAKAPKRPHEGLDEIKAKSIKLEDITLKGLLLKQNYEEKARADVKARLSEMLLRETDPIAQLKQVLSNPDLAVPDPLLVPRARLPALVASPASEIPRLLKEKKMAEPPLPPLTDPDTLVVSLSHLRSLLAYKCSNTEDLTAYQKSLEAFLEWQRYQTELMEAQVKASAPLTPNDIDMATANAFNQMLWLPYLNQLDSNRELMGFLNSMCSPYGQSSPFLTPTSPMEGHMKTLAMWQDAMMSQQGGKMNIPSPSPPEPRHRIPTPSAPRKRAPNQHYRSQPSYEHMLQQQAQYDFRRQQEQQHRFLQRQQQQRQQEKMMRHRLEQRLMMQQQQQQHQQQMYQMQQNYTNFHDDISKQLKLDLDRKQRSPPGLKPLPHLIEKKEDKKSSWCQFEEDLKKSAELTNQMARQWQQFEEEMRRSQIQILKNQKKIKAETSNDIWSPPVEEKKTVETKPKLESTEINVPKLKVKNLVDPSMSPPKLLKVTPPEHLLPGVDVPPLPEDPHSNLWHPLFGSNQGKPQSYTSPWRWTTVTVNGE